MAAQRYFIVDAFTNRPFAGNPAAVVPLDAWPEVRWLQHVAREMNLSETAFFVPNGAAYELRWFTPTVEVDLCGHATLASTLVLAHLGRLVEGASVAFSTRSGTLRATREGSRFHLDFPRKRIVPASPPLGLLDALRVTPSYVGRHGADYLLELESEDAVRAISPEFSQLLAVDCRGVIVTGPSNDPAFDFVSRFFAPAEGIDEDPVTGSAHCCLADFWGEKLQRSRMVGHQVSARGGTVHVEIQGDRVQLGGDAVLIAEGRWLVGYQT